MCWDASICCSWSLELDATLSKDDQLPPIRARPEGDLLMSIRTYHDFVLFTYEVEQDEHG
jgi:hypothetical protein